MVLESPNNRVLEWEFLGSERHGVCMDDIFNITIQVQSNRWQPGCVDEIHDDVEDTLVQIFLLVTAPYGSSIVWIGRKRGEGNKARKSITEESFVDFILLLKRADKDAQQWGAKSPTRSQQTPYAPSFEYQAYASRNAGRLF